MISSSGPENGLLELVVDGRLLYCHVRLPDLLQSAFSHSFNILNVIRSDSGPVCPRHLSKGVGLYAEDVPESVVASSEIDSAICALGHDSRRIQMG